MIESSSTDPAGMSLHDRCLQPLPLQIHASVSHKTMLSPLAPCHLLCAMEVTVPDHCISAQYCVDYKS